jgi:hypothetical protein
MSLEETILDIIRTYIREDRRKAGQTYESRKVEEFRDELLLKVEESIKTFNYLPSQYRGQPIDFNNKRRILG